jgi:hypothetical protein
VAQAGADPGRRCTLLMLVQRANASAEGTRLCRSQSEVVNLPTTRQSEQGIVSEAFGELWVLTV